MVTFPPQGAGGGDISLITGLEKIPDAIIPTTQLTDTQFISFRTHAGSQETFKLWAAGVQNNNNNTPTGLTAEVDDETNTVNLLSENTKRIAATAGSPIASATGPVDIALRIENDSGSTQNATGIFSYTIE